MSSRSKETVKVSIENLETKLAADPGMVMEAYSDAARSIENCLKTLEHCLAEITRSGGGYEKPEPMKKALHFVQQAKDSIPV